MKNLNQSMESSILLKSGTNELEVLVFRVGQLSLGINVAKVREILSVPRMTQLPAAHPSIYGCFQLRKAVVPCLSLHKHLDEVLDRQNSESVVILTEFNQYQLGFLVDVVERIHRISWSQVMPLPAIITNSRAPVTAITRIDNRIITMLDFETIASQVTCLAPNSGSVKNKLDVIRNKQRIAIADDSPTARRALAKVLRDSGYTTLFVFENGAELWNWMVAEETTSAYPANLVITDVEMPVTDGFHLTRKIKEDTRFSTVPVLLYSSILTPDNLKKGQAVGADAQITKPELYRVVSVADQLIHDAAVRGHGNHSLSA